MPRRRYFPNVGPLKSLCIILLLFSPSTPAVAEQFEPGVVAQVNGHSVTLDEVRLRHRPTQPHVGVLPPKDSWLIALDEVIALHLLSQWAAAHSSRTTEESSPTAKAKQVQSAIDKEMKLQGVTTSVSEKDALEYYRQFADQLNPIDELTLSAIVVPDKALAEELLNQAHNSSTQDFTQLVERHSIDIASRDRKGHLAVIDAHGKGLERPIAEVALKLRKVGDIGLALGSDHRYYVLRTSKAVIPTEPWSNKVYARVKNLIAYQRRQKTIGDLTQRLRDDAEISINTLLIDQASV